MNTKFLKDGRKVAVVGQINQQEFIVQEIYITEGGDEIPQGEKFTTKTLLDAPRETYQAREERRIKDRVATVERERDRIEKDIAAIKGKLQGYRAMFAQVKKLAEAMPSQDFNVLCGVMSGTIKWVSAIHYGDPVLLPFDEALFRWENDYGHRSFGMIRLVSLMGKSDGATCYRIHDYSDGSGSGGKYRKVQFFDEKSDAIAYLRQDAVASIGEGKLSLKSLRKYEECGVAFTVTELQAVAAKDMAEAKTHADRRTAEYEKAQASYAENVAEFRAILGDAAGDEAARGQA